MTIVKLYVSRDFGTEEVTLWVKEPAWNTKENNFSSVARCCGVMHKDTAAGFLSGYLTSGRENLSNVRSLLSVVHEGECHKFWSHNISITRDLISQHTKTAPAIYAAVEEGGSTSKPRIILFSKEPVWKKGKGSYKKYSWSVGDRAYSMDNVLATITDKDFNDIQEALLRHEVGSITATKAVQGLKPGQCLKIWVDDLYVEQEIVQDYSAVYCTKCVYKAGYFCTSKKISAVKVNKFVGHAELPGDKSGNAAWVKERLPCVRTATVRGSVLTM